tara:strand:+ start:3205 stop:3846 length:642 start_codon:yes stop_codon:yes gene_type:complete
MSQGGVGESSPSMPEHDEYVAGVGDEQGLRLAERLMSRFTVTNSEEIFELINKKAYNGGILIMLIVLCWWVLITEGGDDVELATSFLFNLNYLNVAITVGLFGLISSGLTSIAKEKGQLVNSLVSGAMLIVCGFFIIEPLFYGITGDEINAQVGLWRSSRLLGLFFGVTFCARFLVDAWHLYWVKTFLETRGLIITSKDASEQGTIVDGDVVE